MSTTEVRFYSLKGLAQASGLTTATIQTYRKRGTLPPHDAMVDNKPLWSEATVQEWLINRRRVEVTP